MDPVQTSDPVLPTQAIITPIDSPVVDIPGPHGIGVARAIGLSGDRITAYVRTVDDIGRMVVIGHTHRIVARDKRPDAKIVHVQVRPISSEVVNYTAGNGDHVHAIERERFRTSDPRRSSGG